jgi:hypothetical protein
LGALTKAKIPVGNHDFIRAMTTAVGVAEYRAMAVESGKPFVLATRRDGLPALRIYYGYTTGFASEDEALSASGTAGRGSSSGKGPWFVAHPINEVRPGGERPRDRRRKAAYCGTCGMQLSLTGVCDS